jgi:hypothetical protein
MPNIPEVGNQTQIAYILEPIPGTTPATPAGQILPWSELSGFTPDRDFIDNPVLRSDNMQSAGRGSYLKAKPSLGAPLAYGLYDDWLAAALGNWGWTANVIKVAPPVIDSAASISILATGKTWTRPSGSFITDGFAVGMYMDGAGDPTNAGNNSTFLISAVTATIITCATATGLVDSAGMTAYTIAQNIQPSFTIEKLNKTNGYAFPFLGTYLDGFELSGDSSAKPVMVKFNLLAKTVSNETMASLWASLVQPNTNPQIAPFEAVWKKGTTVLPVTKWSVKVDRNSDTQAICGVNGLYAIKHKAAKVTVSMDLLFDSTAYAAYTDMRAENDIDLHLTLGPGGTKTYQMDLTRARIKTWKGDPKDGLYPVSIEVESYAPISGTNTHLMLTRLP